MSDIPNIDEDFGDWLSGNDVDMDGGRPGKSHVKMAVIKRPPASLGKLVPPHSAEITSDGWEHPVHFRGGKNAERLSQSHQGKMRVSMGSSHIADGQGEIVVPCNIDTLRDDTCPVCGSKGTLSGDRCAVCGYAAVESPFQAPDTSLAAKVRDQMGIGNPTLEDQVAAESALPGEQDAPAGAEEPFDIPTDQGGALGGGPDLVCDNCGATFNSDEEDDELNEPHLAPAARIEPDVSALGVPDDLDEQRELARQENMAGTHDGVAFEAGSICPSCGEGTLVPMEEAPEGLEGEDSEEAPEEGDFAPEGEEEPEDETGAPLEEDDEDGDLVPGEEEDEDEDDEDDEGPPQQFRQRKGTSTMPTPQRPRTPQATQRGAVARQGAVVPNPAAQERRRLMGIAQVHTDAINRQGGLLEHQDRAIRSLTASVRQLMARNAELAIRNETLERQMALVADASGLSKPLATIGAAGQARLAAIQRRANPFNPAQPVPEPGAEPPVVTSQEAMAPEGRDDVTQLGASPVTNVSADAVTSVDVPYGELASEPVGMVRTDVTAPVAGTEVATPPEMTVIPVDTRIGNPDNPQPAFPWTAGPVGAPGRPYAGPAVGSPPMGAQASQRAPQRPQGRFEAGVAVHPQMAAAQSTGAHQAQAHYIAAVNLARLRNQVGISNEDPFALGTKIASQMTQAQISAEAQGLQAVASQRQQPVAQAPFNPGPAFQPVTASAAPYGGSQALPSGLGGRTASAGSVLPPDPSFQSAKYAGMSGPGASIAATTMFAPRPDEMGWDSPV